MKLYSKYKFDYEFLISFLIFSVPFLLFSRPENTHQFIFDDYVELMLLYIFVTLSGAVLAYLLSFSLRMVKMLIPFKITLMAFAICFYQLFLYHKVKIVGIEVLGVPNQPRYPFAIIMSLNLLTIYLTCKFFRVVKVFSLIYGIFILGVCLISFVQIWSMGSMNKKSLDYKNKLTLSQFKDISAHNNIYYIILDGMTALNIAERILGLNTKNFYNFVDENGLVYIENSRSTHNSTVFTLGSVMHLSPVNLLNEPLELRQLPLFPRMMNEDQVPLLDLLYGLNYDFKWYGSEVAMCRGYFNDDRFHSPCEKRDFSNKKSLFSHVLLAFLSDTPLFPIQTKLTVLLKGRSVSGQYELNDALGRFVEDYKGKPIKPTFSFIHHFSPHLPYINDANCNELPLSWLLYTAEDSQKSNVSGYKGNYECALKKVQKFIKTVSSEDPNAVVFIQGDHGWPLGETTGFTGNVPEGGGNPFDIFNLAKVPAYCESYLSSQIDNVNAVRLALACATNTSPMLLPQKSYATYRIDENNSPFMIHEVIRGIDPPHSLPQKGYSESKKAGKMSKNPASH